jgi:hypothetical protein
VATQLTLARQLGEVVSDGLQERGFEVDGYEGPDDYYLAVFREPASTFIGHYRVTSDGKILATPNWNFDERVVGRALIDMGFGSRLLGTDHRRWLKWYERIMMPVEEGEYPEEEEGDEGEIDITPDWSETYAETAVKELKDAGVVEASSSPPQHGDWFMTEWSTDDYATGQESSKHFFLEGFTEAEENEIYKRMSRKR